MIEQSIPTASAGLEEDRLAEEAKESPGAFQELYERYLVPIYRFLASRVDSPQDAEDLTAQVFLTAFERLHQYRGQGKFTAWLYTIARNKSVDFFRVHRREVSMETVQAKERVSNENASEHDDARTILNLIAHFSPEEQELLALRFGAEMSFIEMAELLHRNESAVKKHVYRLLARIKQELEENHG